MNVPEISVQELNALRVSGAEHFLLDVRNADEYAYCNLGGHLMPLPELSTRLHELNPEHNIIVHCHAGGRSSRATEFLLKNGFKQVRNLRGGITAWSNEVDSTVPVY